jgi:ribose transport system substrate-binding protein
MAGLDDTQSAVHDLTWRSVCVVDRAIGITRRSPRELFVLPRSYDMRCLRRLLLVASLLGAGTLIVACGSSDKAAKDGGSDGGSKPIKIGYINLANSIPFSHDVEESVKAVAKKHNVEVLTCDSALDAQKAIDCAAKFKTQGVQGIANFQQDATASPRVCAAGPDVPTVAIDIPQKPCMKVYFGADNYKAGVVVGEALGEFAKSEWNCEIDAVVSINAPVNDLLIVREKGELDGIKKACPDFKLVKVKPTTTTTDATIQPFTDTLTKLPGMHRLLVVGINDDLIIGAIKGAVSSGRAGDIYVGGNGADPTSVPYICGENSFKNWVADSGYFPERYGEYVIPVLLDLIAGKPQPESVYMEHAAVTKETIGKYYPDACS